MENPVTNEREDTSTIIPDFYNDVALECLVRVSLDYHTLCSMRKVSKKWRKLLSDYNSGILKERRMRNLQQPSMFLFPHLDSKAFREMGFLSQACLTYKSSILLLGGDRNGNSLRDFWIIDTLRRTVKRGPNMLQSRKWFVGGVVDDSLFVMGGRYAENIPQWRLLENAERYDFATQKWVRVSPLPFATTLYRCYADSFSSSTTKLFAASEETYFRDEDIRAFCYSPSNDNWALIISGDQVLVPPESFIRSWKWMWCSGSVLLTKGYLKGKEVVDGAWQLSVDMRVTVDFLRELIQPAKEDDDNYYENPFEFNNSTRSAIVFSKEDNLSGTGIINAEDLYPSNAEFYPLSILSKAEQSSMICDIVTIDTIRDHMRFSKHEPTIACLFAILFY